MMESRRDMQLISIIQNSMVVAKIAVSLHARSRTMGSVQISTTTLMQIRTSNSSSAG